MLAEPIFHDKFLIGNGEACSHCEGKGSITGKRARTFRRCKPCKGTGRGALPAEVIVARTRPSAAKAPLLQEARDARELAEMSADREEIQAKAEAAAKPVERICGVPMPVEFGRRDDDTMWISFGVRHVDYFEIEFAGSPRDAEAFARFIGSAGLFRDAFRAARSECRDPDTDATLSSATGDLIENALRALGERL